MPPVVDRLVTADARIPSRTHRSGSPFTRVYSLARISNTERDSCEGWCEMGISHQREGACIRRNACRRKRPSAWRPSPARGSDHFEPLSLFPLSLCLYAPLVCANRRRDKLNRAGAGSARITARPTGVTVVVDHIQQVLDALHVIALQTAAWGRGQSRIGA